MSVATLMGKKDEKKKKKKRGERTPSGLVISFRVVPVVSGDSAKLAWRPRRGRKKRKKKG